MENIVYMDTNGVVNPECSVAFFKLPQFLFTHPTLKKLSCESKLLYAVMLNRYSLSATKPEEWSCEGHIYIRFAIDVVMEVLNCCKTTAVKALKELKENHLVLGKRDADNRSVKYYFLDIAEIAGMKAIFHEKLTREELAKMAEQKKIEEMKTEESKAEDFSCPDGSNNQTGTGSEAKTVQVQKVDTNKTDTKNTDSHQDLLLPSPSVNKEEEWWRSLSEHEIKEMISESWLGYEEEEAVMFEKQDLYCLRQMIDGFAHNLFVKRSFNIDGRIVMSRDVFHQLLMLQHDDIEYSVESICSLNKIPYDMIKYAIAVFYNAPRHSKLYWTMSVQKGFTEPTNYPYAA